jgi:hypothetical protein
VKNPGGTTLVTNAGSNGKFLGVMDFEVRGGKVSRTTATGCCRCSPTAAGRPGHGRR